MDARWAAVLWVAVLVAGCAGPSDGPGPTTSDPPVQSDPPVFDFSGPRAYGYVEGLVTFEDGTPRYRVPGTEGHAAGADWLETQMALPGWDVMRQSFTGEDYQALDRSQVSQYGDHPAWCLPEDKQSLNGTTFHNLVATWTGDGEGHIVLGAHWDSKEEASEDPDFGNKSLPVLGANDGASGVGVLLALMEHVANGSLAPIAGQLTVVFYDGEDGFEDCHPLAGSLYHAQSLQELPDAMLLLDMVGDPAARFPRESRSMQSAPGLMDLLWHHGARAGLGENLLEDRRSVVDDHVSYIQQGVPSVDVVDAGRSGGTGFPPYWHTTDDTLTNIDAGMLGRVGAMVATTLSDPTLGDVLGDPHVRLQDGDVPEIVAE